MNVAPATGLISPLSVSSGWIDIFNIVARKLVAADGTLVKIKSRSIIRRSAD